MSTNVNACQYCGNTPGMTHKSICPLSGVVGVVTTPVPVLAPVESVSA